MKTILLFLCAIIASVSLNAQTSTKPIVEVYYFHATNRCATCNSIEANTRKTLETNFAKELKEGKIKFTVLNSDDEKNKALCEKYEAYGATLILVRFNNGKEASENLTNFAFSYSRNQPEKFMDGLKLKLDQMLKG
jgi:hypothetical protein